MDSGFFLRIGGFCENAKIILRFGEVSVEEKPSFIVNGLYSRKCFNEPKTNEPKMVETPVLGSLNDL